MAQIDVIEEFKNALDRKKMAPSELAVAIHVTPSAVTNWIGRKKIPQDKIPEVIKAIGDYRFALAVAEYLTGIVARSVKRIEDTPYARYFSQAKEENDRKKIDPEFTLLMGKRKEDRTSSDRLKVKRYIKELSEEIEEKNSFLASIMEDWDLSN